MKGKHILQQASPGRRAAGLLAVYLVLLAGCAQPGPARTPPGAVPAALTQAPAATATATALRSPEAGVKPSPAVPSGTLPASRTPLPASATPSPSPSSTQAYSETLTLGESGQGRPLQAFRFGTGPVRIAFIGGIHGGYEWNTILLAYQAVNFFNRNPGDLPMEVSLYILPAANPDGLAAVTGHAGRFTPEEVGKDTAAGRLNAAGVDLNRNWDCNWEPDGFWRDQKVSAGEKPFSEPETQTLRDFLTRPPMDGVVFWHSAVPAVYAGGCDERFAPADGLAETYAAAAGYPFELQFTGYSVTGSAVDWLALQGIPAIEVELSNHSDTDWEQNLKAMIEVLAYFREKQGK